MTASNCQLTFEVVTVIDNNCLCSLEVSLEPNAYIIMLLMRMSLAGDHLTPANYELFLSR